MVNQRHLFDIERLEAWIEAERIKINNAYNNIHQECAKNTADCGYLVDILTRATAALAVIERLEAWIEAERSK